MSFDVLSRHVSTNTKLLVEASAGTGKTFTIEHLFIKRLLEVGPDMRFSKPSDIAVVTFTRAVARELSFRIRRALDQAIQQLATDCTDAPDYIAAIKEQHGAEEAKMRLLEARATLESAEITTIHGFCNRMLSEYQGLEFEESRQISAEELNKLVDDFFTKELQDDDIVVAQLTALLRAHQKDFSLLRQAVVDGLWDDTELDDFDPKRLVDKIASYGSGIKQDLEELTNHFTGCQSRDGEIKRDLQLAIDALACGNLAEIVAAPLYVGEWFSKPKVKSSPNQELCAFLLKIEPLVRQLADPELLLQHICKRALVFVRAYMAMHTLFSQEELLHAMAKAIEDENFRKFLQKRFRCLIVDEFQDTDPLQWKILKTLFVDNAEAPCSLFLVGDPKQAIYAFRKADVYCYVEAKKVFQNEKKHLTTNYRSSPNVVSALNTLFTGPHSRELFLLPKLQESIEPQPLSSGGRVDELNDGKAPVIFLKAHGNLGRGRTWPSESVEQIHFHFIAQELQALFGRGIDKKQCAILVKDRYQAARCEAYLKQSGIAVCANSRKAIGQSPSLAILKRLLLLCRSPRDKRLLASFLAHMPLCYDEKRVSALLDETQFQEWADHVAHVIALNKIFDEKGFSVFFQAFLDTVWCGSDQSIEALIVAQENGRELLSDLEALFDCLIEHEFFWGKHFDSYYNHIRALETMPAQAQQKIGSRFDPQESAVSLLTLHAAKGLEFDVVFALGLASRHADDAKEHAERDAEALRLFYVAATRAKKRLYLPICVDDDLKPIKPGSHSPMELFLQTVDVDTLVQRGAGTIAVVTLQPGPKLLAASPYAYQLQKPLLTLPATKRRFLRSFSGSHTFTGAQVAEQSIQGGKLVGTLLHDLLREMITTFAVSHALMDKEACKKWLIVRLAGTHLQGLEEEVSLLLTEVFHFPIKDFTLAAIDWKKAFCELEFVYQEATDHYVRGVIDLVFEHEGLWYIVDWKSNVLDDYSEASLKRVVSEEGYAAQALLYKKALFGHIEKSAYGGFAFFFLRGQGVLFV